MTEPTLKPGTRCQCREGLRCDCHRWKQSPDASCQRDAVRMVTVRDERLIDALRAEYNEVSNDSYRIGGTSTQADATRLAVAVTDAERGKQVPMCAPCAAFAEKAGVK